MTGVAGRDAAMVHGVCRKGSRAGMAQITIRIAARRQRDMRRARTLHPAGAVMARTADSRNVAVMVAGPQPSGCAGVAGTAFGYCIAMRRAFTLRLDSIVATGACARPRMSVCSGKPGLYGMAIAAWVNAFDCYCAVTCRLAVLRQDGCIAMAV